MNVLEAAKAAQNESVTKPVSVSREKLAVQNQPKTRKIGKRSDPAYMQAAFWLTRGVSADLDIELGRARRSGEDLGDRSDVVEKLLRDWIALRRESDR